MFMRFFNKAQNNSSTVVFFISRLLTLWNIRELGAIHLQRRLICVILGIWLHITIKYMSPYGRERYTEDPPRLSRQLYTQDIDWEIQYRIPQQLNGKDGKYSSMFSCVTLLHLSPSQLSAWAVNPNLINSIIFENKMLIAINGRHQSLLSITS